jgi:uncharacterized phage-associated protein
MKKKKPTTAQDIAADIVHTLAEHGDVVTPLKLQKLVYYAQAWYLAIYDKPLFKDKIQAWAHGPVVPSLYHRCKDYGYNPINPKDFKKPILSKKIKEHLAEVYDVYSGFSAWQLEQMTHEEAPWKNTRKGIPIDSPCSNVISHKDMKNFYREISSED